MSQHDTLLAAFETYKAENEKFIERGIKASAARARKALQEIAGACKERRKEITATKYSELFAQACNSFKKRKWLHQYVALALFWLIRVGVAYAPICQHPG
ncbi:hypothetical protein [Polynucleobacter necessarius]|uniref:hypothetical protein n=1 Tax=Polynucleobacter necessarius TaxID=576610 RepID=UPI000E08DFAD